MTVFNPFFTCGLQSDKARVDAQRTRFSYSAYPSLWHKTLSLLGVALLASTLSACGNKDNTASRSPADSTSKQQTAEAALADPDSLYLLAGSELKDIEPFLADIKNQTGVSLSLDYTGTIDGAEAIAQGKRVDGAWFSHGKYLTLMNPSKVIAQTPIMLSPVVMGVKQSKAQQLGWLAPDGKTAKPDITWQTIAEQANNGQLKYAMTSPTSSNSGFTALMGVVSALAGTSDAPTDADIAKAKPNLKAFFQGQTLTAGSSGWLSDAFVQAQKQRVQGGQTLDGMVNYESTLMQLNHSGVLPEPLVILYPKEGIVTADYPLMLMNNDKKAAYDKVAEYLKTPEFQTKLMQQTFRRPANAQVALSPNFHQGLLVELPFPNSQSSVDAILAAYSNELRLPARPVFILDTSGSMSGEGMNQLKKALTTLTDGDGSLMGRYAKFSDREQVTFVPFDSKPRDSRTYTINATQASQDRQAIHQFIEGLDASGGTAIYSALHNGYQAVADQQAAANNTAYYYSLVLMTDGKNTNGESFADFKRFYEQLPPQVRQVKTFTVMFGDADPEQMQQIADLTGGRVFDGRKGDLASVFKQIRGYQ